MTTDRCPGILMAWFILPLSIGAFSACAAHPRDGRTVNGAIVESIRNRSGSADESIRVSTAFFDLNGDGTKEAISFLQGDAVCGSGGCSAYILAARDGGWKVVTRLTVSQLPIRVLYTKTAGWSDIGVHVKGGGVQPRYEAQLKFNGTSYPPNPTIVPDNDVSGEPGEIILSKDSEFAPLLLKP